MSYMRSSYKASSSSYRYSSSNEGTSSTSTSRFRASIDDDGSFTTPTSRRTSNYGDLSYGGDDIGSSTRRSYQTTSRLTSSHYSTGGDDDFDTDNAIGTRFSSTSKYKISHVSSDDDDLALPSSRKYSRYNSRDESDNLVSTTATSRISRYSSYESGGDEDVYSTTTTRRRTSRLGYLNEEDDKISSGSRSYRPSLGYEVTTPVDEEIRGFSSSSYGEGSAEKRRFQSTTPRSLSRTDSKDSSGVNQVYEVILDYKPPRSAIDEISLKEGQEVIVLSKDKPHKWKVRTRKSKNFTIIEEGFAPSAYLKPTNEKVESCEIVQLSSSETTERSGSTKNESKDLNKKRDMVVRELIETEEDLVRDMQFVQRTYIRQSESSITPKEIKSVKDDIFSCFKELLEFHKDVLLKNFQNLAKEPSKIGTLFLKMESDFSNHSKYCKNLPKALEILDENPDVSEYFNNYSVKIRDEKPLSEHLKMPIQRLSDYQLLLKELSKNLSRMDEDVGDLEKAIKLIADIPNNEIEPEPASLKKPESVFDFKSADFNLPSGSTEKLSNLLKNVLQAKDFFDVIENDGTKKERFIFFFKSRMFITEINKNISAADQRTYNVEKIIKLPEVEIYNEDANTLVIKSKDQTDSNFPLKLRCNDEERIKNWLKMINALTKLGNVEDEAENDNKLVLPAQQDSVKSLDENNNKITKPIIEENSGTFKPEPESRREQNQPESSQPMEIVEEDIKPKKVISANTGANPNKDDSNDTYEILADLKSITRPLGGSAMFQCQVSPGTVSVQWLKDNQVLSGSNYKTYKNGDLYILELRDLTVEHSGIYTFIASNSKKSVASSSSLNVLLDDSRPTSPGGSFLPGPPKFKVKLKDTELIEGATVRFEVIVRGLPIPNIQIFKDGQILQPDDHLKIIFQSKEVFEIVIEGVRTSDSGEYKCIATNPEGRAETSGRITVTKNKDVFFGVENSPMIERDPHSPRCMSPMFKWFKDGKEFEASERFQVQYDDQEDTVALLFQHVTPNDAGLYTCVAATSSGKISCNAELNVQGKVTELPKTPVAPAVLKELSNVEVVKGQTVAMLEAQISGYPKPQVLWFKGNQKLETNDHYKILTEGDENFSLVIKNVTDEDAGKYKLEAANQLGHVESFAELNIVKKPEFEKSKDKIEVSVNEQLVIEQTYDAAPEPVVKWQKDGRDLKESDRIKTVIQPEKHTLKLIVDKATSEDAGNYVCMISNNLGSASQKTVVNVKSNKPQFLKKFEAVEIFEHETAIFSAQCTSEPGIKIEFYKENQLIGVDDRIKIKEEKDGKFQLIIKDCGIEDEGKYKCRIKNNYGYEEDEASLVVKRKPHTPEFKEKLKNLQAQINDENVQLTVQVDGEPKPVVEWYQNGKKIIESNDKFKIVEKDNSFSLIIPKVTADHQGVYTCKLENAQGKAESSSELVVKRQASAPKFKEPLKNMEVLVNEENVKLMVQVDGEPKPMIKWFHDGNPISSSNDKYKIVENDNGSSLIIPKVMHEHQGTYVCKSENAAGQIETSADLLVKRQESAPKFKEPLENMEVMLSDENVKLMVQVDGEPKPVVKWFHDGEPISASNGKYKIVENDNGSSLIIPKVMHEHQGTYVCKSENASGQVETSAELIVKCPPYVVKHLENFECCTGMDVQLTAIIKGHPKPEIKWFCNDKEIKMTDRKKYEYDEANAQYKLFIKKFQAEDLGIYKITAQNTYGQCFSSSEVQIASKPLFNKVLKNILAKEMESNIEMVVQLDPNSKPLVKWFKDDVEIKDDDKNYKKVEDKKDNSYKLVVMKATSEAVGKYKCVASNEFGSTETAARFDIITKPRFIKGLEDIDVMEGNNVSMTVQLAGFPKPEVSFYKNGEEISAEAHIQIKKEMDDIYQLEIENIRIIMSGEYECRIKNEAGEASSKGVITVSSKPQFLKDLTDQTVKSGEDILLEVVVTGNPSPEIRWFINGKETAGTERILLDSREEQYRMKMLDAQESDSGVYHCTASNKFGESVSEKCKVKVEPNQSAPMFVKRIEDTEVVVDDNVRFDTVVSAIPKAEVTWSKDSVQLKPSDKVKIESDGDNHTLIMKKLQKNDSGVISCKAQNAVGFTTQIANIMVEEPTLPTITGLTDKKVIDGEPLKIEAHITGFPRPIVEWYKDNQPYDTDPAIYGNPKTNQYGIDFPSITSDFVGTYTCTATNCAGKVDKSCSIEICGKKPNFVKELEETQIVMSVDTSSVRPKLGQSAIFETIIDGEPIPEVKWYKNDKELRPSDRVVRTDEEGRHVLEIKTITKDDVAKYTCKATNQFGEAQTVCLLKFLNEPHEPIIKKPLEEVKVEEGDQLKLFCRVDGEPMPAVRWLKDDMPLEQDRRVEISSKNDGSTSLIIDKAIIADTGTYQVEAENAKGTASSSAKVLVVEPQRSPSFLSPLKEKIQVDHNDCIVLEATVFGLPKPKIEWFKDGKPIVEDGRTKILKPDDNGKCRLEIKKAKGEDSGEYSLKAINNSGETVASSNVQVMPEPFSPLVVENLPAAIQVTVGEPIEVLSKISAYPIAKVTWLKDNNPLNNDDRTKITNDLDGKARLTIESAQPEDQGIYVLKAENSVGETSSSTKVQVFEPEEEKPMVTKQKKNDLLEEPKINFKAKPNEVNEEKMKITASSEKSVDSEEQIVKPNDFNQDSLVDLKEKPTNYRTKPNDLDEKPVDSSKSGKPIESSIEKSLPNQINVADGENLKLEMKLTNKPLSVDDIQVFKDDVPLRKNDTANHLKILENGEIQFSHEQCSPKDGGLYRIEVQTPNRSLSSTCLVNVSDKIEPVEKKLKFKKELEPVEVQSGSSCRLECVIEGNPNEFQIAWFKDDEELLPNEHYGFVKEPNGTIALLIDSFASKDVGMYKVKISNNQEQIFSKNKASLKPSSAGKTKPEIVEPLQDVLAQQGSLLVLKCRISPDSGPVDCKWFCNGKELNESDSIKFLHFPDGTIMMQMKEIPSSASGKYKVVISNQVGESSSEANIKVESQKPAKTPNILRGLEAATLIAGEPGSIEFQVDSPNGDVTFLLKAQNLIPDDRIHVQKLPDGVIRLNFDVVNLNDSGLYTAVFKNDGGSVDTSALVNVKSKPIITKQLEDQLVKEKCSTRFETCIVGNPEPEVVWMKNGSTLKMDETHYTSIKCDNDIYCLIINDCVFRDKADYSVKAINELGSATSKAKLDIISGGEFEESSPIFLDNLRDMTAAKGDKVVFNARIKAHPVPKILWKKDNKEIQMNPEKIFTTFNGEDLQLTILNFEDSDKGIYEVYVENQLGQTSSSAKLSEHEEICPKFIKELTDLETGFQSTANLTCKTEGYPKPTIKWLFNGKPIEGGLKYNILEEFGEQVLTIFNPAESDSGLYECIAENHLGCDKTSCNVLFSEKDKDPAQFIEKLQDYDVLPGATARLTACVIGNPKPEFKWFKDEKEIKIDGEKFMFICNDNGMITFEVRNVSQQDLGKYRCFVSNKYGSDNSIGQLNFETVDGLDRMHQIHKSMKSQQRIKEADDISFQTSGLPDALTEKPIITKMVDDSLTLLWIPSIPEQPRFPVSYVVEFCKVSDGTWTVYHDNIKDSKCDVVGLEQFEDYGFRVKVENKFGISEPSPSVTAFRSQLKDKEYQYKTRKLDDIDLKHVPPEKIAAPVFLREEESFMFGIVGQPCTIEFWIYAYPEPDITWFFGDKKLDSQDPKFKFLKDRNGKTCLFINKLTEEDFGYFSCLAKNEHGEEKRTIQIVKAEPPQFTKTFEETEVLSRNHIRLQCSVQGNPEPTIKWFKDFQPLHDTSRIKVVAESPDNTSIVISDAILRDSGLYSCTATNIAGSRTTSAYIHVKEKEVTFEKYPSSYKDAIKPKNKKLEQFYDIGDELGRGTQGTTYHVVERSTGKSYAAKIMHGTGEMRQYMNSELEIMNQLGSHEKIVQLNDCFASTPYSTSLIMNLQGGGTLMDYIIRKGSLSEQEVADYIKQVLEGLHYMHYKNIGHFGLTIGDILMTRINGSDITICDFGLAQRVPPGASHFVEFGQPEFVSPEIVNKNSVTLTTDVWSAGIIAHILLTGISPFLGENDRATLQNIQNKNLDLSDEKLGHVSQNARDFLRKTLNFDPKSRIDVKAALNHPWIKNACQMDKYKLNIMENLRDYKYKHDKWYQNASCRRYYRRRQLHSCYTHPSRMIYPPDEQYSPMVSPEREMRKFNRTIAPFENIYPPNQKFGVDQFSSESHYQCGPDTYLLQLRDTDFPARIRRYLRVAAVNSPLIASNLGGSHWGGDARSGYAGTFSQPSIKERRKFTDIMDEEISDERRGNFSGKPRRLAREVGTPLYLHGQWKTLKKETGIKKPEPVDDSNFTMPFFREKLKDVSYRSDENVVLTCYAVGTPEPTYTWFRNDSLLIETNRIKVKRTPNGHCQLILEPSKEYDVGVYKCVARNTLGSVVCRARLSLGDVPGNVYPPHIKEFSSREVLLMWSLPKHLIDTQINCYKLEFKKIQDSQWLLFKADIKQEFCWINELEPNESYHFRLFACNEYGWSEPSAPSETVKMLSVEENQPISRPAALKFLCEETNVEDMNDYTIENNPIPLIKSEYKELYDFRSIVATGKFSVVTRAYIKDGSRKILACKCVLTQSETESAINNEYEISKSLVHEKIARLQYANRDSNIFTLATDLCCGLNVLTYLSQMHSYTEELVARIICQVLDGIEYLHFRNIGLLELQPDNVLMVDQRSMKIKLTDFANSRYISSTGSKINISANPEYIAPELIRSDEASLPYSDVWTVGVLAYILLSGHSPFKGNDPKETAQNVVFVRYLFERLYPKVTQEAIRFLLTVFKLTAHKRPTIEECLESKWLLPNEFMIRKREAALFDSSQINKFTEEFFSEKSSQHSRLFDLIGLKE